MFKRIYIEITDCCNLACSFCPGTKRPKRFMTPSEFRTIAEHIRPHTGYIYLHVMGEPLLHPDLREILSIAQELGFMVNITTNGTLLAKTRDILLSSPAIRKISVSLHSFEGNSPDGSAASLTRYLDEVWQLCSGPHPIIALRLWNSGGAESLNAFILDRISCLSGTALTPDMLRRSNDPNGIRIGDRIYIESADRFDWPATDERLRNVTYCHGLTQQLAVLCDGTVVPCCLDSDGTIALGNILEADRTLEQILDSPRARAIVKGFRDNKPSEELCRRCGFAERFK